MKLIKHWNIRPSDFNVDDAKWIIELGCQVEVNREEPQTIQAYNKVFLFQGHTPDILITSTTEDQEILLKLKYGDSIMLMAQLYVEDWMY